jgi:alpha-tubulin suppressor-like RCC1 family protein
MSALDVLRQIKLARKAKGPKKVVEWGNAEYINSIGLQNIPRRDLRNHLEARDLDTNGTRLELIERLRISLIDEQLHKFAYTETVDAEQVIQADLEERGSVYVVGINDKGQLGLGDTNPRNVFTVIPQLRGGNVNFICTGMDMVFAITDDHDVYVWGGGGVGRNGLNPNGPKSMRLGANNWLEPQLVHDLAGEEAIHISSGLSHNLACGKGGDCFVWGHGDSGQLGLGNMQHHLTVAVNNSFPPVAMTGCGSNHSMALTRSGQVLADALFALAFFVIANNCFILMQLYSWGHAANGRLGLGAAERVGVPEAERFFFPVPALIATLEPIKMISCGADHTIAMGNFHNIDLLL